MPEIGLTMTSEPIKSTITSNRLRDNLIAPINRCIVAKVGDRLVTFPDTLVSEIMILDRNTILTLPFYETAIIGVVHYQASIMPLLLLRVLIGEQRALITESLSVVRLSKFADKLSDKNLDNVGIVVDRVMGSLTTDEYQNVNLYSTEPTSAAIASTKKINQKKINQTVADINPNEYTPIETILSNMSSDIWQPQRWQHL